MHQSPPRLRVFSRHVTGMPRSLSAFTTGKPLDPAPTTQTLGRATGMRPPGLASTADSKPGGPRQVARALTHRRARHVSSGRNATTLGPERFDETNSWLL